MPIPSPLDLAHGHGGVATSALQSSIADCDNNSVFVELDLGRRARLTGEPERTRVQSREGDRPARLALTSAFAAKDSSEVSEPRDPDVANPIARAGRVKRAKAIVPVSALSGTLVDHRSRLLTAVNSPRLEVPGLDSRRL
jgi:hypothetical protein